MKKNGPATDLLLKDYLRYLLQNKIEQAGAKYLSMLSDAELPLLSYLSHLSEEALLARSISSLEEFITNILTDSFLAHTVNKTKEWKENLLKDVQRGDIVATDLLLINSIRKQLLIEFLPDYTPHSKLVVPILQQLETTLVEAERINLEAFLEIQNEELYEKNQFLSQLIHNSVNGVLVIDKNLIILEWNPILQQKLRIKREEALGKNLFELLPQYKNSREGNSLLKVFEGKKVATLDAQFRHANGWYDAHTIPIFNKENEVYAALHLVQDITNRKNIEIKLQEHKEELQTLNEELLEQKEELQSANEELQESLQQLKDIQNAMIDNEKRLLEAQSIAHLGSWEYNLAEDTLFWSDEMKRIFGFDSQFTPDYQTYLSMLHPDDFETVQYHINDASANHKPYTFEHRIIRKDGAIRYILANGSPEFSRDKKLLKLRGTGMDITELKQAEINNLDSQNFIKKITETTPDIITVFDLEKKKNIYANKEIYEVLGYSPEEISFFQSQGLKGLEHLVHPEDLPIAMNLFKDFSNYKGNETREIEYRIKSKSGDWLWILGRYNIFKKSASGLPVQLIGISREITFRKQSEQKLKESERRLKDSQVMAHLGNWELNADGKHIYWSDELYNIFKIPPKDPLSLEKILSFMVEEDRPAISKKIENSLKTGEPYHSQYRIRRTDGEIRYIMTKAEAITNAIGEITGMKGTTQDVTDRRMIEQQLQLAYDKLQETNNELRQSEEALKQLNNDLETKVAQRTQELLESNERLLKKNADLDNFIYTASHDLKVPIANIEGLLNVLKSKVNDQLKESDRILLNMMHESVERFNITIRDLTEISKIQKNLEEESHETISIPAVLDDLTQDMADIFADKNAILQSEFQIDEIFFTKKNLRSILYNLIINALKYSSPERNPVIKISTQKTDSGILLSIQDNGLGIPENQLQKIFSLFKRYHTNVEGSGIGLYIVKRIIENSGGKIEVESKVDFGTTFKLYFNYLS